MNGYLVIDRIATMMVCVILFLSLSVASYSYRYMKGEKGYGKFFLSLAGFVTSLLLLVCSDFLPLFFLAWCSSFLFLVAMMSHNRQWAAAKNSALLAAKNFSIGALSVGCALFFLFYATGSSSIAKIIESGSDTPLHYAALLLLTIGAMTQSAIPPFHRWLLSSLNSPTPVSAIMHAGFVNGGYFLLARFAPLFAKESNLMILIFAAGLLTALTATFWKLVQSDIKRMLACSTIAQMGFMFLQCSLGLFSAAFLHLVTHGLFKSYLFLKSGSAAKKKNPLSYRHFSPSLIIPLLVSGAVGSASFALATGRTTLTGDSRDFLLVVVALTAAQFSLPLLLRCAEKDKREFLYQLPLTLAATAAASFLYGLLVRAMAQIAAPIDFNFPQQLHLLHYTGMALMVAAWGMTLLWMAKGYKKPWALKLYVKALNASQPHPATVTPFRNDYTMYTETHSKFGLSLCQNPKF